MFQLGASATRNMREIAHSWKPEAVKGSVTKNMCQIGTQSQRLGVN